MVFLLKGSRRGIQGYLKISCSLYGFWNINFHISELAYCPYVCTILKVTWFYFSEDMRGRECEEWKLNRINNLNGGAGDRDRPTMAEQREEKVDKANDIKHERTRNKGIKYQLIKSRN